MTASRRPLAVLFLTVFVDLLGFGIVIPILPTYADRYGASALAVGLLGTTYSAMQLLFAPLWGRLSDRVGRRPVIVATALGSAVAYSLFGLGDELWLLFVARAAGGICGANISTAQAYIADVTAPEDRARGMAIVGAGFGLGFTFGPALGGLAAHWGGVHAPFFLAAGLALVNALSAALFLPEPPRHARRETPRGFVSWADAFRIRRLAFFMIIFLCVTFAFANIEATFALFNHEELGFGERENAYAFTFIGLVLTLMQAGATRPLTRRFGELRMIIAGTLLVGASAALIPTVSTWWHLALPCALLATGNALYSPSLMATISQSAPADRQGEMLGVSQSLGALGRILGPAFGGFLFDTSGHAAPYIAAACIMALVGTVLTSFRWSSNAG